METFKKIAGASLAFLIVMTLMATSLSAQHMPSVAVFDNIGTVSEEGKLKITWTNLEFEDAHYFVVEKLDENWDYQLLGKVSAHPMDVIYSMEDINPVDGENYYRITVVTLKGEELQSELMVADHFDPRPAIDFLPEVSNSLLARILIENSLKNSELVNPKYNSNQLAVNRILSSNKFNIKTNQLANTVGQ